MTIKQPMDGSRYIHDPAHRALLDRVAALHGRLAELQFWLGRYVQRDGDPHTVDAIRDAAAEIVRLIDTREVPPA